MDNKVFDLAYSTNGPERGCPHITMFKNYTRKK